MSKCNVFVPYGALGTGILEEAFEKGMSLQPDILSCDAGSTDSGPFYLGAGKGKYARKSVKTDLRRMMVAAHKAGIPITIGSSGTCGVDAQVDELAKICQEICEEEHFSVKVAKIYTEQYPGILKEKFRQGKLLPLEAAPEITEEVFEECTHIVALAGVEPFIKALEDGADVVICGRATDTAVLAAMPIMKGCGVAAAWHAAKICECGSLCTTSPSGGGVFMTVDDDSFIIRPTAPGSKCTTYTVSAHLLYENSNPFRLVEPGVIIDTSESTYEQLEDGGVLVKNTKVEYAPSYTMKLEGSSPAGFQTIAVVGLRDREIMRDPEKWMRGLVEAVEVKLKRVGYDGTGYSYSLRPYGWNAVYGGEVPEGYVPNELGVILVVTADTQELATQIAKVFNPSLLHFSADKSKPMPSFAFPFSPSEIERGQLYRFRLHHVVETDDPLELVRIETDYYGEGSVSE